MSFPRYKKYKPSGVEWLGDVPEHWALRKLKSVASFCGGGTPSRDNLSYWNGDIPWVSPKDMKAERIVGAEESITVEGLKSSASNLLSAGRVLMVVRSGILKHTIPVAINETAVALNQDMKALDFDDTKCLAPFFLRWVQGLNDQLLLAWAKQGATVESIEHSYLADTVLPLPDVAEQTQIAAFLDRETAKIDELVAEQRRLMELLKEKRQAVISHAVTQGLKPKARLKPSGVKWLGTIPEHWDVVQSRRLFRVRNEPARESDQQLTASQKYGMVFQSDFVELEGRRVVEIIKGTDSLRHAEPNDFVISLRSFQGGLEWCKLAGSITFHYVVLVPVKDVHEPFFAHLFKSLAYIQALRATTNLIRDGQDLRYSNFVQVDLPVVPLKEQAEIASYLDREVAKFDTLTAEAQRAIDLLQERRTALISAAVTGQIDVRTEGQCV